MPFYTIKYKNKFFNHHKDLCEDPEKCFKYVKKHLNLDWTSLDRTGPVPVNVIYDSRLCTKEEVGEIYWKRNKFWICPEKNSLNKLKVFANNAQVKNIRFRFNVHPNQKSGLPKSKIENFVNDISVTRFSKDVSIDWNIMVGMPIEKYTNFVLKFPKKD